MFRPFFAGAILLTAGLLFPLTGDAPSRAAAPPTATKPSSSRTTSIKPLPAAGHHTASATARRMTSAQKLPVLSSVRKMPTRGRFYVIQVRHPIWARTPAINTGVTLSLPVARTLKRNLWRAGWESHLRGSSSTGYIVLSRMRYWQTLGAVANHEQARTITRMLNLNLYHARYVTVMR